MAPSEVRKGDRVVFVTGEKEYNGIALNDAKVSVHPGVKRAGIFLDIVYLNEDGASVKVLSSPVLVAAVSEADLKAIAETEYAAWEHDRHRKTRLKNFGGDIGHHDLREEFLNLKQSSGWKPFVPSDEVAALTAERDELKQSQKNVEAELEMVISQRAGIADELLALKSELEKATAERDELKASLSTVEAERDQLLVDVANARAEGKTGSGWTAGPQINVSDAVDKDASGISTNAEVPSAADLDAVSADQTAAEATSQAAAA